MSSVGNLTCLTGPNRGREYKLTADISTVGRSDDCTIKLDENLISRKHAEIHRIGTAYQLHDLGGKNGVYLNGTRLAPGSAAWLENGGEVSFAFTQFLFNDQSATVTSATIASPQEFPLRVDRQTRDVFVDGQRLDPPFSVKQFELLYFLVQNQNLVVSKDEIADAIWPEAKGDVYDANIDRMVSRVRSRVEPRGGHSPRFISTVHGYGYRLSIDNG